MAKTKSAKVFNLLKPVEPPKTAWDKAYDWLVNKARIIVFTVEILIVIAFATKFIVDTSAKSKEKRFEALRQTEAFYAKDDEPEFRRIQAKSRNYGNLWDGSSAKALILEEVYTYIPTDITEVTIQINEDRVILSGYQDLNELKEVEDSFKASDTFSDAYIEDLSLESEDVILDKGRYSLVGVIDPEAATRVDL